MRLAMMRLDTIYRGGATRRLLIVMAAGSGVAVWLLTALAQETRTSGLSELLRFQSKVHQLETELSGAREAFAQCRADAANVQARLDSVLLSADRDRLNKDRALLASELKTALGGTEADEIDWRTDPPSLKKTNPQEPK